MHLVGCQGRCLLTIGHYKMVGGTALGGVERCDDKLAIPDKRYTAAARCFPGGSQCETAPGKMVWAVRDSVELVL